MSIDVEIIPTAKLEISWGELKEFILKNADDIQKKLLGDISLVDAKRSCHLSDLDLILSDRGYLFDSEFLNTLTFVFIEKDSADDEKGVIEDYGNNLAKRDRKLLLDGWCKLPYSIFLSSGANRSATEKILIGCVGAGLAEACDGRLVVSEVRFFNLKKGIYHPEQFARVKVIG